MTTTIVATVPVAVETDPFGLPILPGDLYPPTDEAELARLDEWVDRMESEHEQRYGNDFAN